MPPSSVYKQIGEELEEVLRTIREEYDHPHSVLCESELNMFVGEEEIHRKQLKEIIQSESDNRQWRSWIGRPSSQATNCLKSAQELKQRVKDHINAKVRARVTGKSSLLPSAGGPVLKSMGAKTSEADTGRPTADDNPVARNSVITSPLNMTCSSPVPSELIVFPGARNNNHTSGLNEAINTPLETSGNGSGGSSTRRRREPPPPPALPRSSQSRNSAHSLGSTSNPGSSSPRRSSSVRRSAPLPPQSPRHWSPPSPPISGHFSSHPAIMSSIYELTQHLEAKRNKGYVTKTNCIEITGSTADGVTLNNGGTNNSGAVIHKTGLPRSPQTAAQI